MNDTAATERALLTALGTIHEHWAALIAPTSSGGTGTASSDVITGLDRRVSLRHEVTLSLNSWARLIVEEKHLTHHLPLGTDTLGLIEFLQRWARWFSGHEAATDAADELNTLANQVHTTAAPPPREWHYLGDCPFIVEDWFCAGQVRQPAADPDAPAICTDCGQTGEQLWWEDVITGRCQQELALHELPDFIYRYFGRHVARPTLHRWIKSGELKRVDYVRTPEWFNRAQVIDAVTERWLAS